MARLTITLNEYPDDGRFHGVPCYDVNNLPAGQKATIEPTNIRQTAWKVDRWTEGTTWTFTGEYPSVEVALTDLQALLDLEMPPTETAEKVVDL